MSQRSREAVRGGDNQCPVPPSPGQIEDPTGSDSCLDQEVSARLREQCSRVNWIRSERPHTIDTQMFIAQVNAAINAWGKAIRTIYLC